MKEWLIRLWTDASVADRVIRTAMMAAGSGLLAVSKTDVGKGIGAALNAAAVFIPAGEKNVKPPEA